MRASTLYSLISPIYDLGSRWNGHALEAESFVARLPLRTDARLQILDAGCGTGSYTLPLLRRFPNAHVTAFDVNREMLTQLRRSIERMGADGRMRVLHCSAETLPADLGPFDLIVTGGLLEYVDAPLTVRTFTKMLKPGGLFLNSPVRNTTCGKILGIFARIRPWSRAHNIRLFTDAGFSFLDLLEVPKIWSTLYIRHIKEAHLFRRLAR